MSDTKIDVQNKRKPNKKRNKKRGFNYFFLFAFVFIASLSAMLYIVKSYSPDVDVTIGNNEAMTLGESDIDVEVKAIDERLKWIQMEDDIPTVSIKPSIDNEKRDEIPSKEEKNKKEKKEQTLDKKNNNRDKAPVPTISDIKRQDYNLSSVSPSAIIPKQKPQATKIYLGYYNSLEDAVEIQNKASNEDATLKPFIKAVNNQYIVQLGSFTDEEKANAVISKFRAKGFNPKVNY